MDDLARYAKLLRVDPNAELPVIKEKYAEWRQKFERQLRSDDIGKAQKGQQNLMLLDQAYQALAARAVSMARRRESPGDTAAMSFEIGSHRIGFNINNVEGFQVVHNRDLRRFKVSWPGAKVTFYNNKMKIKGLLLTAEMEYRHIENIKRFYFMPFVFEVKHRSPDVLPSVILIGPGLGNKIRRLNEEHRLDLPISY